MRECKIQGEIVAYNEVCTHWTIWNRKLKKPIKYEISISFDDVENAFNSYWVDVIEREKDPDLDDGLELTGIDKQLKNISYPALSQMLREHSNVFCEYIKTYLQTEFIGYIVDGSNGSCKGKAYCLHSIEDLKVNDENVYISGDASNVEE